MPLVAAFDEEGTTDEHIKCLADMVATFKPRERHDVPDIMRLSGLEPFNYAPNEKDYRKTFINLGERCNVAGSTIFKKAIVDGNYEEGAGDRPQAGGERRPRH